nr:hypothetical protein [Natrinema salaciae]
MGDLVQQSVDFDGICQWLDDGKGMFTHRVPIHPRFEGLVSPDDHEHVEWILCREQVKGRIIVQVLRDILANVCDRSKRVGEQCRQLTLRHRFPGVVSDRATLEENGFERPLGKRVWFAERHERRLLEIPE